MKITQAVPAMFAALWAMLRNARALLLYVGQLTRSAGLFTPNRKPAKSEMSVELRMIPMLLDRMASLLRVLSAGALIGCASSAVANPISISEVSLRLSDHGPNDLGFIGEGIQLSANSVTPNGIEGPTQTTATAETTYLPTGALYGP